jgi:hypothetical protein
MAAASSTGLNGGGFSTGLNGGGFFNWVEWWRLLQLG